MTLFQYSNYKIIPVKELDGESQKVVILRNDYVCEKTKIP